MKKVSIIIPAYNVESYIKQCAESVLQQTLKDIEIIFIDDGSTDKTGKILDNVTFGYDNATVIHQGNKGLYKSREIGLSLAEGEYIGWVDADDFVEPDMFETLYNLAVEKDSELVICNYDWYPDKIPTKEKWFREYLGKTDVDFIERNNQVWNKIVKRELLERLNIGALFASCFDEIYILVMMEARNPLTVNQSYYYYRVGSESMSSSYTDVAHYRGFVESSKALRNVMREYFDDAYWQDYFHYRVIYYLIVTMIVAANSSKKADYIMSRNELRSLKPTYQKNQHYWRILKRNFGWIKALIIGGVIPINYTVAYLVCKMGLRS